MLEYLKSYQDIIQVITTIATIITSVGAIVISVITWVEMKRQRKSAYRPEISVNNKTPIRILYHRTEEKLTLCFSHESISESAKFISPDDPMSVYNNLDHVEVDLFNIGVGVARNVEYNWYYDLGEAKKTIESYRGNKYGFHIEDNGRFCSVKFPELNFELNSGNLYERENKIRNFLFSYPVIEESIKVTIPKSYLTIWAFHFYQRLFLYNNTANIETHPLQLFVSYFDSDNKPIKKIFTFNLQVGNFSQFNSINKWDELGVIILIEMKS
jgi:hypothetical protein